MATKRKKKKSSFDDVSADDDTDPFIILDDKPAPVKHTVAVGQRFWLLPRGHRRKARPVQVASAVGGEDSVTIRCLDNGEKRVLPLVAFATAGTSRVLRA